MAAEPPKILADRYVLQDALQSGGMATVFRARDLVSDELVAVKRFDRDRHLPEIEREAFWREVEALRNLTHPHIVKLRDSGEDASGRFFVVLDLMKHDLIAEKAGNGRAFEGWDDWADLVVLPLLDALSFAHEAGIAHRDVKPANILVAEDGSVRLADFSISKLKRTLQPRITLNTFMSPPFAPPESDTGSFSYTRDVYAIAALCIWAMSSTEVSDHEAMIRALPATEFSVFPRVVEVMERCLASDPAARYQSAPLLLADIERIQAARRQHWQSTERPSCLIGLTRTAGESLRRDLESESEKEVREFLANDINTDSAVSRYIENYGQLNERVRPKHYNVFGSSFQYHVAEDDRGHSAFVVVNAFRKDPDWLQWRRDESLECPLHFSFESRTGVMGGTQAQERLLTALDVFETEREAEARKQERTALFDTWIRVLQARMQHAREATKPIQFSGVAVDGPFVTLETQSDLSQLELGDGWVIEGEGGKRIRGEVWEVGAAHLVLNCANAYLNDIPESGVLRLDLYALKVAIDRQRDAIDSIRSGTCVRSALRDVLLRPFDLDSPSNDGILADTVQKMLDASKQRAVRKCVDSEDLVLVEGPPGTGKTQFIVGLILQTLENNPNARILLASQTHIAIDNAIERLARIWDSRGLIRIAREASKSVADTSKPYLLNAQMMTWQSNVIARATEGMQQWASERGVDFGVLRVASIVRQLAASTQRSQTLRESVALEEQRKTQLSDGKTELSPSEREAEADRISAELEDIRDQLNAEKTSRERLEAELKARRTDATELIQRSPDDQIEWATALTIGMDGAHLAQAISSLQADWFDRFGSKKGLVAPLVERSSVVATTCLGLATVEEASETEFDLCIIDEASKATAMEASVPMSRARKWILVGDSKQLPPFQEEVMARPELREQFEIDGLEAEESAFERMRRLAPDGCRVMLTTQYRMVEPIGRLVSECFYDGLLESVRRDVDPDLCRSPWRAVNWFSTRELRQKREERAGTSFVNSEEASKICDLVRDVDVQLDDDESGRVRRALVLSGYGAQVQHLSRRLNQIRSELRHIEVECCTVDRVQGREADIVFFSVTRSNPDRKAGFLRALERVNVALSRALDLLVIVGDDEFVQSAPQAEPLQRVLAHIRKWPSECFMAILQDNESGSRSPG